MLKDSGGHDGCFGLIAFGQRRLFGGYCALCLLAREKSIEAARVHASGSEVLVIENAAKEAEIAANSADDILLQSAQHTLDCRLTGGSIGNQFGEQGIVFDGHD